jgi:hypothetical protein
MIRLGRHENKLRLLPVAIFPDLLRSNHWKAMHSIQYWNVIPWKSNTFWNVIEKNNVIEAKSNISHRNSI